MRSKVYSTMQGKTRDFYQYSGIEMGVIKQEIVKNLKKARRIRRLSQSDVASTKIISQTKLSFLESGKRNIMLFELIQLAALYQVGLNAIIPEHAMNSKDAFLKLTKGQDI